MAAVNSLLVGQIIFGFGSIAIETAQDTLYSHWARGSVADGAGFLGLMYGFDIAIGRVFNLAGKLSAVPVAEQRDKWYWTLWLGAILCFVTLLINVFYICIERRIPQRARVVGTRQAARKRSGESGDGETAPATAQRSHSIPARARAILATCRTSFGGMPASFWLIMLTHTLQAGAISSYVTNLPDVISVTRGYSARTAGYTGALTQAIPIVLTPFFGLAFDLFGRRMHTVSAISILWVVVFVLLAYTTVHTSLPVVLGSVALAGNAIPFAASIPILVRDQRNMGTAFGIWQAFNAAGSTIVDVSSGAIQDHTPTGKRQYDNVFYFLIALKGVDVINGFSYIWFDKRCFGGVLRLSEKGRVEQDARETQDDRNAALSKPIRTWTVVGAVTGVALIVVSYVV